MIVFIDEAVPYHPDIKTLNGLPACPREVYFDLINQFFTWDLKDYIVALHPRTPVDEVINKNYIGHQIMGMTHKLLEHPDCKHIYMHTSSLSDFAIKTRKPVTFLTCDEFNITGMASRVRKLARSIGQKPIDMRTGMPEKFKLKFVYLRMKGVLWIISKRLKAFAGI